MPRIYKTADGRHVLEGNPDAAFLAYSQYDSPPAKILAEVELGATDEPEESPAEESTEESTGDVEEKPTEESKQSVKVEDKQAVKPADKGRGRAGSAA